MRLARRVRFAAAAHSVDSRNESGGAIAWHGSLRQEYVRNAGDAECAITAAGAVRGNRMADPPAAGRA
jgi:hypothetical protein